MIFNKINAIKDNLTDNEKKIVEYLKNNCNDSKIMTSTEIASRINVSQPSVIRLSKKLGYSSFREMLADLPNEEDTIEDRSLQDGESDEETLLKISTQMCEIIESTRDVNDLKDIQRCVRMIKEAPSVILFGVESSNLFAHYMANQLTKLGIVALTSENYHTTLMQINNASKDSVCFLFSETGETEEEFQETLDFVSKIKFTKVHVFPYSRRKGTKADTMPNQIPENIKKERVLDFLNPK